MGKDSGRLIYSVMSVIVLIGILFIILGYLGFWPVAPINQIFLSIGSALLSAGTVGIFSKFFLSDVTADIIFEKLKGSLEKVKELINNASETNAKLIQEMSVFQTNMQKFSGDYPLLISCAESGIVSIYNDRIDNIKIKKEIITEMWKSSCIKMVGTSLRQFFWKDSKMSTQFLDIIRSTDNERTIQILVSNPFTKSVVKRTLLEEGPEFENECKKDFNHYKQSSAYDDIRKTLNNYKLVEPKAAPNVNLTLQCYTDFPSMWMVITDNFVFFQPYQYGKIEETRCIGESFFIMKIRAGSDLYRLLNQHFVILWKDHSNQTVDQMLKVFGNPGAILQNLSTEDHIFWTE